MTAKSSSHVVLSFLCAWILWQQGTFMSSTGNETQEYAAWGEARSLKDCQRLSAKSLFAKRAFFMKEQIETTELQISGETLFVKTPQGDVKSMRFEFQCWPGTMDPRPIRVK